MSNRRKGEATAQKNERGFPYVVQIAVPEGGFGPTLDGMNAWHHDHDITIRYGRRVRANDREYERWCFSSAVLAIDFRNAFGGVEFVVDQKRR